MEKEIFKNLKADFKKLLKYGFIEKGDVFEFEAQIVDNQFELIVAINKSGKVATKVIDKSTNEDYVLHRIADSVGEFVGRVRSEFEAVLLDIKEKCFERFVFKSVQAQEVIKYVKDKYGDELEFLWEKFPSNAVWRRKDNAKWYGALLTISKRKLGFDSDELVEIIDLRVKPEKLETLIDNKKYFAGYHMNKKHWFTICLDNSVETVEIYNMIDISYLLAKS